jgi:hypothetical protein
MSIDKFKQQAVFMFIKRNSTLMKCFLGILSIIWGIELFNVGESFPNQAHFYLTSIASAKVWGLGFILHGIGSISLAFKTVNTSVIRLVVPIVGFLLWTSTAVCSIVANSYPMGAPVTPSIMSAFLSWWLLIKIKVKDGN